MLSESGSSSDCCTEQRKEEKDFEIKKPPCNHIPRVDTEELSEEQKTIVRKMLEEEAQSFSQTDDDLGRAEELHWIHVSETLKRVKLKTFLFQSWTMELKNHAVH